MHVTCDATLTCCTRVTCISVCSAYILHQRNIHVTRIATCTCNTPATDAGRAQTLQETSLVLSPSSSSRVLGEIRGDVARESEVGVVVVVVVGGG